jgi:hypothetical protein
VGFAFGRIRTEPTHHLFLFLEHGSETSSLGSANQDSS